MSVTIRCPSHGEVELSEPEYERQLLMMDDQWRCPTCQAVALDVTEDEDLLGDEGEQCCATCWEDAEDCDCCSACFDGDDEEDCTCDNSLDDDLDAELLN